MTKEPVTGSLCTAEHHVQTAAGWREGVGVGSGRWLGMQCLCGAVVWDYLPDRSPELLARINVNPARPAGFRDEDFAPVDVAYVGQWRARQAGEPGLLPRNQHT